MIYFLNMLWPIYKMKIRFPGVGQILLVSFQMARAIIHWLNTINILLLVFVKRIIAIDIYSDF